MSVNVVDKSTGNVTRVAGNASDSGIGNLDSLTTRNKSSLVAAINEVNSADGDSIFEGTQQEWSDLSTAEKTAYDFAAITDDYTPGSIGNLNSLTTTDKSSVVGAVNELNSDKKDEYITITYAQWQALTPAQQAAKDYYISDYPSSAITAGNVSYNNSSSGMTADDVQEAVDELNGNLNGLVHKVESIDYITTSTSISYTGIHVTIPANSYFFVRCYCIFGNSACTAAIISLSDDPSQSYNWVAKNTSETGVNDFVLGTSYCGYTPVSMNLYLHARYIGAAENEVGLIGGYITQI